MILNLIVLNIIIILILLLIPNKFLKFIRLFSLISSFILFILSLSLWVFFNNNSTNFQFYTKFDWLDSFNLTFAFGLDGLSLFFLILSTFLIPLCILVSYYSVTYRLKEFLILLFCIELFLIIIFSILDLILFYIFFEAILIPMFLLIGVWGSRRERIYAAYQFFFYTLVGSLFMLVGVLILYSHVGTTDYLIILNSSFSEIRQIFLWLAFFASFAVKIPMLPFHIWLPQAHVEAPTAGSVILAGILLKLGGYGFLRFSIPMFPFASKFFIPLIFTMSLVAIVYASLTTIRQIDLKRIIAYSSVAHMNYITLGMFSFNLTGLEGAYFLMLSHGLVSSALFLGIGCIYDRYKARIIRYYGGLAQIMPLFAFVFLFLTFSNISFPLTSGFVGEILIIVGVFEINKFAAIIASIGTVFGAVYSIWVYNRIFFNGPLSKYIQKYSDMNRREFYIFLPLIILIIYFGVYPNIIFESIHLTFINMLNYF